MCLALLSFQDHPQAPLLLAANRDEVTRRPSLPPALLPPEAPGQRPVFGGQDVEAGGTWLGRNDRGLLAVLTNIRPPDPPGAPRPRSRGAVTLGMLRQATPEAAADWLEGLPLGEYRPFNLLFGNAERLYAFSSAHGVVEPLEPGTYVLSNSSLDDTSWPKVARTHLFYARQRHLTVEDLIPRVMAFLSERLEEGAAPAGDAADPRAQVFLPSEGYGTVSSALLTAGEPVGARYYYAGREALLRLHREGGDPLGAYARLPLPF